ncbi:unnamed protein product, partial [Ilex paraguariensis]
KEQIGEVFLKFSSGDPAEFVLSSVQIPDSMAHPSTLETEQIVLLDDAPKPVEILVIHEALILLPVLTHEVTPTNSTIVSSPARSPGMELQAEELT